MPRAATAWAGVAVAATDARDKAGAIIAAALALPGVVAHADNAPEHGQVAVKYLDYRDSQPGFDRIKAGKRCLTQTVPRTM